MDTQGSLPPPTKPQRRRHSRPFREQVVAATLAPGASVAGVAQQFQLNANLVHKWRRQSRAGSPEGFIRLPLPAQTPPPAPAPARSNDTLRVELGSALGPVTLHWPMAGLTDLAAWLRALA